MPLIQFPKKRRKRKKEEDDGNQTEELSNEEKLSRLKEILSSEITEKINDVVFMQLLQLDPKDRKQGKKVFINALDKVLTDGVRTENIQSAKEEIKSTLKYSSLTQEVKDALAKLIDFAVVENSFFDVEKTMQARNEAATNVAPVIIRSGDIIVREGQIITNEIYEDLKLAGLLQKR